MMQLVLEQLSKVLEHDPQERTQFVHTGGLALLQQITEPLLAPARKLIPPMGGLDFSPILVFLLIGVVERILPQLYI